jgi:hypothetical protein
MIGAIIAMAIWRLSARVSRREDSHMAKTKVFVSYDHSEDAHYKTLLQAWDANPNFDFDFDSRGPNVAINSENAATIKASLATARGC